MVRINQNIRHHFEGIRGKVGQFRELAETIDTVFDSFHRMNRLGKDMFGNIINPPMPDDFQDPFKDKRKRK
ncbi:hypothetical protein ACQCN2_17235 [Brevibacillus ginsengisoli]|uniref:hypothetical protein n=1 Tax=Brevibacillus ginsengisoli TaxID=363854 RepID=UPI003CF9D8D6